MITNILRKRFNIYKNYKNIENLYKVNDKIYFENYKKELESQLSDVQIKKVNMLVDIISTLTQKEKIFLSKNIEDTDIFGTTHISIDTPTSDNNEEIRSYLKEKINDPEFVKKMGFSVSAAGLGKPDDNTSTTGTENKEEPKKEEKTTFNLILESFDASKKLSLIKEIKTLLNIGLKEAKEFVEKVPSTVKENIKKEEIDALSEKISKNGGKLKIF